MTEVSGPWDGSPGTFGESQWGDMFGHLFPSGVFGSPQTTDLLPYADSSGMHVKVRVGYGFVNGQYYQNTAEKTVNVDNGDAQDRIDVVVLTRDSGANTITAGIHKGTASATPAPPTLTAQEVALAHVLVKATRNTSIAAAECTDWRQFMPRWTRPGLDGVNLVPSPEDLYAPQLGDLLAAEGKLFFFNDDAADWQSLQIDEDTGWLSCTMAGGWVGNPGGGSYPPTVQVRVINGVCYLRGYVLKSAPGSIDTDYLVCTLPGSITVPYTHRWASVHGSEIMDLYIFPGGGLHALIRGTTLAGGNGFPLDTSFVID